jgi:hypothetical protein
MTQGQPDVSTKGFVKTFVLPSLLIFLIQALTLAQYGLEYTNWVA